MKLPTPDRDIANDGLPFFTYLADPSGRLIEDEREAHICYAYANGIRDLIRAGRYGWYLHGIEEIIDLCPADIEKLMKERRNVMSAIYSWQRRSGMWILDRVPFRNVKKKTGDDRYFDAREYAKSLR